MSGQAIDEVITDRGDVPNWVRLRVTESGRILLGDGDDPVHMGNVTFDPETLRLGAFEWTDAGLDEHISEATRQQWMIFAAADLGAERRRREAPER